MNEKKKSIPAKSGEGKRAEESNSSLGGPGLIAGGMGAVAFIATLMLGGSFLLSIGASLGVFGLSWFLLVPRPEKNKLFDAGSGQFRSEVLGRAREQIFEMEVWIARIKDARVRIDVEQILRLARSILGEVERDPKDFSAAKSFLNYHFQAVAKILRQYVELSEKTLEGSPAEDSLRRVENGLKEIKEAFQKQYENLLANDALDLDAELKVLEQSIQMEGLSTQGREKEKKGGDHE
jgi:5-bromo-4-chloroindolyl phosphate hydrolysis protein